MRYCLRLTFGAIGPGRVVALWRTNTMRAWRDGFPLRTLKATQRIRAEYTVLKVCHVSCFALGVCPQKAQRIAVFCNRNFMCSLNRNRQESLLDSASPAEIVIPIDTWDKLFVFQSKFDAYNAKGMLDTDPQGGRWFSEKQ